MISDEYVKQLFHKSWSNLNKHLGSMELSDSQIHRGCMPKDPHPGGCDQHLLAFNNFNIILDFITFLFFIIFLILSFFYNDFA